MESRRMEKASDPGCEWCHGKAVYQAYHDTEPWGFLL